MNKINFDDTGVSEVLKQLLDRANPEKKRCDKTIDILLLGQLELSKLVKALGRASLMMEIEIVAQLTSKPFEMFGMPVTLCYHKSICCIVQIPKSAIAIPC